MSVLHVIIKRENKPNFLFPTMMFEGFTVMSLLMVNARIQTIKQMHNVTVFLFCFCRCHIPESTPKMALF